MTELDIFNFCLKHFNISIDDWNNTNNIVENNLDGKVFNLYYDLCEFLNIEPNNEFETI